MRWFLTMIAVAAGAWYVSNRQRRDRVQHSVREAVPPGASKRVQRAAATVAEACAGSRHHPDLRYATFKPGMLMR